MCAGASLQRLSQLPPDAERGDYVVLRFGVLSQCPNCHSSVTDRVFGRWDDLYVQAKIYLHKLTWEKIDSTFSGTMACGLAEPGYEHQPSDKIAAKISKCLSIIIDDEPKATREEAERVRDLRKVVFTACSHVNMHSMAPAAISYFNWNNWHSLFCRNGISADVRAALEESEEDIVSVFDYGIPAAMIPFPDFAGSSKQLVGQPSRSHLGIGPDTFQTHLRHQASTLECLQHHAPHYFDSFPSISKIYEENADFFMSAITDLFCCRRDISLPPEPTPLPHVLPPQPPLPPQPEQSGFPMQPLPVEAPVQWTGLYRPSLSVAKASPPAPPLRLPTPLYIPPPPLRRPLYGEWRPEYLGPDPGGGSVPITPAVAASRPLLQFVTIRTEIILLNSCGLIWIPSIPLSSPSPASVAPDAPDSPPPGPPGPGGPPDDDGSDDEDDPPGPSPGDNPVHPLIVLARGTLPLPPVGHWSLPDPPQPSDVNVTDYPEDGASGYDLSEVEADAILEAQDILARSAVLNMLPLARVNAVGFDQLYSDDDYRTPSPRSEVIPSPPSRPVPRVFDISQLMPPPPVRVPLFSGPVPVRIRHGRSVPNDRYPGAPGYEAKLARTEPRNVQANGIILSKNQKHRRNVREEQINRQRLAAANRIQAVAAEVEMQHRELEHNISTMPSYPVTPLQAERASCESDEVNLDGTLVRSALTCTICLDRYEAGDTDETRYSILDCGHPFHTHCISRYFRLEDLPQCPLCRAISFTGGSASQCLSSALRRPL